MSARRRDHGAAALHDSAALFAALGDETRIGFVVRLGADGPLSTAELGANSSFTRQAITKHLHVLEGAGLVRGTRRGRDAVWELQPQRLLAARRCLEQISRQWDDALDRLKQLVEDEE
jgi:DNA-binding transcriptional ArsR family regulator